MVWNLDFLLRVEGHCWRGLGSYAYDLISIFKSLLLQQGGQGVRAGVEAEGSVWRLLYLSGES